MNTFKVISSLELEELFEAIREHDNSAQVIAEKTPSKKTSDKIAIWCELYRLSYGEHYKVTTIDASNIKDVKVTQELVTTFLNSKQWWADVKTIANYKKRINEITLEAKGIQSNAGRKNSTISHSSNADLAKSLHRRFSQEDKQ